MQVISCNIWNCKQQLPLEKFILNHKVNTDVFCFQEAYDRSRWHFSHWLPDFTHIKDYKHVRDDDDFPQATYFNPETILLENKTILKDEPESGIGLHAKLQIKECVFNVMNFHGASKPGDKLDNPHRLKQSENLVEFYRDTKEPVIIIGDFNTDINTESIGMFEKNGYRNLIKEFNIETTRNRFAWEQYPDNPQLHADFAFVNEKVNVEKFEVPKIEISDHLPLILEFTVEN